MAVVKQGKSWTIMFRPYGQMIKLTVTCATKRQAMALEAVILEALQQQTYGHLTGIARQAVVKLFINQQWEMPKELAPQKAKEPPKEFNLWNSVQLYVNDASFKSLSQPKVYEAKLAHIIKFFGKSKPIKQIWIPDLKVYRTHRTSQGASNASINREMAAFSGVFRVLVEHQVLEINPCRQIKKLSEKSGERQVYISFDDVQRIISACPSWFQDIVWIAYLSGMRKGEIHRLRWSHVNIATRIITFHATETKEGKSKRVPIHAELVSTFERLGKVRSLNDDLIFLYSGRYVAYDSLQWPWFRALDKLGWQAPRPRFHDLRHTWKTNARRSGIDSEIREMILGHSNRSLDVAGRYGFVSDDELVAAIDKFTYDNGLTQILVASKAQK
jgi:integrase